MSAGPEGVTADFAYVSPRSKLNLRWSGDGAEINTGVFESHPVFVRNARTHPDPLTLATTGFQLIRHETGTDFYQSEEAVAAVHYGEIEKLLCDVTGADRAVIFNGLRRDTARPHGRIFGPGPDVHVDYCEEEAQRLARRLIGLAPSDAMPYSRFMAINLWRALSPPPQDIPLAVCDATSMGAQSGTYNALIRVEKQPAPEERTIVPANFDELPKGWIFHYDPGHRWFYYPDMTRDELLLFKLYDSTEAGPWRSAHAAFNDPSAKNAHARESYELRSFVYFE